MRLHLTDDKAYWEYKTGDAITVDVSYRSSTYSAPINLKDGNVLVGKNESITCMVGSGKKVHKATGILVSIDDDPMNWSGEHWFAVSPKCQQYTGRGMRWAVVSQPRSVRLKKETQEVTCTKC